MNKKLIKMLIILGVVLIISACGGGASPILTTFSLPPASLVATVLSNTQAPLSTTALVGIACTDCHSGMIEVGDLDRTPWVSLPTCSSCHSEALTKYVSTHLDKPIQKLTANAGTLYRNSKAHGSVGIYCTVCHGSPHAIFPTTTASNHEQPIRLQGHAGPIVECEVCHMEKPIEAFWHFGGED